MSRQARVSPDGFVQHVLNRGDHRETVFFKPEDFRAFLRVIRDTALIIPMRILAYCIMRNHFHLVLWPYQGDDLPRFMHRMMTKHIRRYLHHYPPSSPGHIYQDRYKNPLIETGPSLFQVLRYVEANALSAGLVRRAEQYSWSSASPEALEDDRPILADWPIERPPDWNTYLNLRTASAELKRIQRSGARGAPYGSCDWTKRVVKEFSLEHTIRKIGRPKRNESELPFGEVCSLV